jgi:hypothetical protein
MKTPCYTTRTGIRIGSAYQAPARPLSYEETRIQSALLGGRKRSLSLGTVAWVCLTLAVALAWITKP